MSAPQLKSLLRKAIAGNEYAPGNLDADLRRVERAYQDEGYLRARVGPPEVSIRIIGEAKAADIRIPVTEGPVYTAGQLAVRNVNILEPDALMQMCPLRKGQPYSRAKGSQWQSKIEETYRSLGHIRIHCGAREDVDETGRRVDLTLECEEGKAYRVGKITVVGAVAIDQLDFKRRLLLSEGVPYNPEMLALSVQFLNQTGRFNHISRSDIIIKIDDANGTVDLEWHLSLPQ